MSTPTQVNYPWRAVTRTAFEVLVSLAIVIPVVLGALGIDDLVIGSISVLAVCAGITRIMAIPQVEEFLRRFLPFLAAEPRRR